MVVSDTIPIKNKTDACNKIRVLSVADLIGEAIMRSHKGDSVTSLFV